METSEIAMRQNFDKENKYKNNKLSFHVQTY